MASFSGSMYALLLAGALMVGAAGGAAAADLPLPVPPPIEPVLPLPFSGWYLRGDVGYGFDQISNFTSNLAPLVPGFQYNSVGLDGQAFIDGGVGYQFNNWFRADLTGEYRVPTNFSAIESYAAGPTWSAGGDAYTASIRSTVVLANGYFDLGTWYGFTPFVGAGVGGAFHQFHNLQDFGTGGGAGGYGIAPDSSMTQLAWALMAGVAYSIAPNWKFELGYRYLDMGHVTSNGIVCQPATSCGTYPLETQSFHMASHDVRIGLRYVFAEVPPMAPPLVTKY